MWDFKWTECREGFRAGFQVECREGFHVGLWNVARDFKLDFVWDFMWW